MLQETRSGIDEYVVWLGLVPIEDPSNEDRSLRRNALRHDVFPLLEQRFPGATAALARYAMLAAEDDRLLGDLAAAALTNAVTPDGRLVASRVREQPLALQRRMIRLWLTRGTGSSAFSADRTTAVLDLTRDGAGGMIEIGDWWSVRRERGMLRVARMVDGTGGRNE